MSMRMTRMSTISAKARKLPPSLVINPGLTFDAVLVGSRCGPPVATANRVQVGKHPRSPSKAQINLLKAEAPVTPNGLPDLRIRANLCLHTDAVPLTCDGRAGHRPSGTPIGWTAAKNLSPSIRKNREATT
jgi:hypothetical protein